jgi:hypothetical protein
MVRLYSDLTLVVLSPLTRSLWQLLPKLDMRMNQLEPNNNQRPNQLCARYTIYKPKTCVFSFLLKELQEHTSYIQWFYSFTIVQFILIYDLKIISNTRFCKSLRMQKSIAIIDI